MPGHPPNRDALQRGKHALHPNLSAAVMINPAVSMDLVRNAADAQGRNSRDN